MQPKNEIPVYLFCGFLEAGKTKYIQSILEDPRFNKGDGILLLQCEEGEEEYDPSLFAFPNVTVEAFDEAEDLTPERLESRRRRASASLVVVEYNGMWQIEDLYYALPENWMVYQQLTFIDAGTIMNYNANMRQLVFDKIKTSDGIVFNRVKPDEDVMPYHKLVRDIDRNAQIIYEKSDGSIEYDEIEDPLPFDVNAPVVTVEDRDYALFYRDLGESLPDWHGRTVKFKGMIARNPGLGKNAIIIGRHVMTCCADDIAFSGLVCNFKRDVPYKTGEWLIITAEMRVERHKMYGGEGPVLYAVDAALTSEPKDPLATFY